MEIWKDIKNYEGKYQISNTGRVKSLNYMNQNFEKCLYIQKKDNGDCYVKLRCNNKEKKINIAPLVLNTFKDNPNDYKVAIHIDGDKSNNHLYNLEWKPLYTENLKTQLIQEYDNEIETPLEQPIIKNLENEIWVDIKREEGLYQISNYGRVKALNYCNSNFERILKTKIGKDGYETVLIKNNINRVHYLVLNSFTNRPQGCRKILHKDGDKTNNKLENLEWINAYKQKEKQDRKEKREKEFEQKRLEREKLIAEKRKFENLENEIWKDVDGFDGRYQISNYGRLKNSETNKLLNPYKTENGYLRFNPTYKGKKYHFAIHRLVAQAFIPNPNNFPVVNHIDENPANNRVDNLEWCSVEYNNNYGTARQRMIETRKVRYPKKEKVNKRQPKYIAIVQYDTNMNEVNRFNNFDEIEEFFQLKRLRNTIYNCCKGNRKQAYGYIWKFE